MKETRFHFREYKHNSLLESYGALHINAIVDQFKSLKEVTQAVRSAGLESSNLIFGKYRVATAQGKQGI